jgi:hypothetical protein
MTLPVPGDRAAETSTTTGTGTYSLAGAISGWRTLVAACGDGAVVDYFVRDQAGGSEYEVGRGTITDLATDTLTRDLIHASSNAGAAVNWSAGTREIVVAFTADAFNQLAAVNKKNWMINGDVQIAQQGAVNTVTSGDYGPDMFLHLRDGTGATVQLNQVAHTLGQTNVPGNPGFYLEFDQTVAGSGATFNQIQTRLDKVETLSGQQITIAFSGKADAARTVDTFVRQDFGTGGSPSADVDTASESHSFTTSWQEFSHTVTLGSVSGKTLGTADDYLALVFDLPANVVQTIDISDIRIIEGPAVVPFPRQTKQEVQADCDFFYQRQSGVGVGGYALGTTIARVSTVFRTVMRKAPTVGLLDTTPAILYSNNSQTGSSSSITGSVDSIYGTRMGIDGFTGMTADDPIEFNDATDVFEFDARL